MRACKIAFFAISFLFILIGSSYQTRASHAMGLDLNYVCLGNNNYEVTMNFYNDCGGIAAPTSATVDFSSALCGVTGLSLTLTLQDSLIHPETGELVPSGYEVSNICPSQIMSTSCNGGSLPGVEIYSYSGIIQLPTQCSDWIINYSLCCRNDLATNLFDPDAEEIYVEATLNNTGGLCNNSPNFGSLPVPYACAGQEINYNHAVTDPDGDSLVFTLINPLAATGVPIPYNPPFSPTNPLNTSGPFVFNSVTGQMTFTPVAGQPQVAIITVLVEEYRNGVLVGSTMRDIQLVVLVQSTCSVPLTSDPASDSTVLLKLDSTTVVVCPGADVSFFIGAGDPDSTDQITMSSDASNAIPGASFVISYPRADSAVGVFRWTPAPQDTGNNIFRITVIDNNCPVPGKSIKAVNIFVLDATSAGPDLFYCPAGGPVQLNAVGGGKFTWRPALGLNDSTIRNPLASPPVTTTYTVSSDLDSNFCRNVDTVTVFRVPNFILALSLEDTICRNGSTQLDVINDPNWAPYTYQWESSSDLTNTTIKNPYASPFNTTTYSVTVTSDTGCTITDSVTVHVMNTGPVVEIISDKNNVCPGDTVQLQGLIFPLECGATLTGCSAANPPVAKLLGDGTASSNLATPFEGTSEDARYQALYRASDLNAAGIYAGTITRIAFELGSKASSSIYQNLSIRVGCTSSDNLDLTNGWEDASTEVFNTAFYATTITPAINSFAFSQPYDWDGKSNLVIEICYNNSALSSAMGIDELLCMPTNYNSSMRAYDDNFPTGACLPNPDFVYSQIPKTTFYICDPQNNNYTYQWSPTQGLSNPTIIDPTTVVNDEVSYTLFVTDSMCDGSGFITVQTDTNYSIEATSGSNICIGDTTQLKVNVLGNPPRNVLSCGVNGTPCINAPHTNTVGTGFLSTGSGTPYEGFYEDGRVQYLFRASELQNVGITTSGTITSLAWNVTIKGSSQPYSGFTIKMGCTNLSALPTTGFVNQSLSIVYTNPAYNTFTGWNTHTLTNPFDWDGISNLIIEVCFDNLDWTSDDDVAYTSTSFNSVLYDFTDGLSGCTLNTPTISINRPNTRFTICDAPTGTSSILWSGGSSISDPTIEDPLVSPDATTDYTVAYTFVNGCIRYDTITVEVIDINVSAGPDTSICAGESVQLTTSSTTNVVWDSLPGLSCYRCPAPIATPNVTTTYPVSIGDSTAGCIKRDSVTITIHPNPFISFSNDTLLCFLDSFRLNAGSGFADYNWSTNDSTSSIWVSDPGIYSVTVTNVNGCQVSDSVNLKLNLSPTVDLGNDVAVCAGDSVELNAGTGYAGYIWNTAATSSGITIYETMTYSVTVTDTNNCPGTDSVNVLFNEPMVDLGNDIFLCAGDTMILIAGSSSYTYNWSPGGSQDSFFIVTQPGDYAVTATDNSGCQRIDSINISYNPDNSVNLGPDIKVCAGTNVNIDAGPGYVSYIWSSGETTRAIGVFFPDTYCVTATDVNGCQYVDCILLTNEDPVVDLGPDRAICQGTSTMLDAGAGFDSYIWNKGFSTQSITVSTPDLYSVTVTDANGCTAEDQVIIGINNLPSPAFTNVSNGDTVCPYLLLNPGNYSSYIWQDSTTDPFFSVQETGTFTVTVTDVNGCSNTVSIDLVVLVPPLNVNNDYVCEVGKDSAFLQASTGFTSYRWSTNDTLPSITVTTPGTYWLTATFVLPRGDTCARIASSEVSLIDPNPFVADQIICPGVDEVLLEVTEPFVNYLWSTNEQTSGIYVSDTGDYSITVTDVNGCEGADTATVSLEPLSINAIADPEVAIAGNSELSVEVANGSGDYSYNWTSQPGTAINDPLSAVTEAEISEDTWFIINVTDNQTGCTGIDSVEVIVETAYGIPDAFVPNGNDPKNRVFQVMPEDHSFTIQEFKVYNRWGELVSQDIGGWDGTYQGKEQPAGTYSYYIVIQKAAGDIVKLSGAVTLLR